MKTYLDMQVTVIIPVYNAARYVRQAAQSALDQPQTGEVLLIEDGSTDDSLAVCRSIVGTDPRVRLLQHPGDANRGVSASRNLGITAAQCEFIAFLDADDWYLPNRFDADEQALSADPTADGVYDAIGTAYEDGEVRDWYNARRDPELITLAEPVPPARLFEALVGGNNGFFCTDGIVVRRRLFDRTGLFDTSLRMGEDTAMWVRMAVLGRLIAGSLHKPVGMRRLHSNNTIFQSREQNARYAVLMAESLLAWAGSVQLNRARTVLLLDWLFNFGLQDVSTDTSYAGRKLRELAYFTRFACAHPLALASRHYWAVLGAAVGTRRLSSLLRGRTCSAGKTVQAEAN